MFELGVIVAIVLAFGLGAIVGSHFFPHIPEGWYYSETRQEGWDDDDIDKIYPQGSEWRTPDLAGKDN